MGHELDLLQSITPKHRHFHPNNTMRKQSSIVETPKNPFNSKVLQKINKDGEKAEPKNSYHS